MNEEKATALSTALRRELAESRLDYGYQSRDFGGHYLVTVNDQLKPGEVKKMLRIAEEHDAVLAQFAYETWVPWNSGDANEGGNWERRTQLILVDPDDPIPFFDFDRETRNKAASELGLL